MAIEQFIVAYEYLSTSWLAWNDVLLEPFLIGPRFLQQGLLYAHAIS